MNINRIREYYSGEEYKNKLTLRYENIKTLNVDPATRKKIFDQLYSTSFKLFCEDFLFLILPEYGDAIKPFFLFEYQEGIIQKIRDAEDSGTDVEILIDKPRGMGITWLMVAYFFWKWMFQPNWTAFILSRTETEVDDGTASPGNSIFAKIRWMISKMPKWTLPAGYKPKGEKGTATDSTLKIINPVLGSGIFGSSTNSNAGRSRRYTIVFVDECFAIDHFTETHRSLTSVARIQIYVSTTKASREAKNFKDAVEKAGNYISLDWKDHPFKDQEWYQQQLVRAEFDPEVMKEIDKGYSISEKLQYYPEIKSAKILKIQYNSELPVYNFLDFGKGDLTVIIWVQFDGDQLNVIDCYWNSNKGKAVWYAPFMNPDHQIEPQFTYTPKALQFMEKVRKWQKPVGYFGELAHTIRSMADGTSIATSLSKCGIRLMYNTFAVNYEPRRTATALMLPKTVFNESSEGAMKLYDALANSRYKQSTSSEKSAMAPVHDDEIADFRAAFENGCVNVGRIFKHQRKQSSEGKMNNDNFIQKLIHNLKV